MNTPELTPERLSEIKILLVVAGLLIAMILTVFAASWLSGRPKSAGFRWPRATLERNAKFHGLLCTMAAGVAGIYGYKWATIGAMAVMAASYCFCFGNDWLMDQNAELRRELGEPEPTDDPERG